MSTVTLSNLNKTLLKILKDNLVRLKNKSESESQGSQKTSRSKSKTLCDQKSLVDIQYLKNLSAKLLNELTQSPIKELLSKNPKEPIQLDNDASKFNYSKIQGIIKGGKKTIQANNNYIIGIEGLGNYIITQLKNTREPYQTSNVASSVTLKPSNENENSSIPDEIYINLTHHPELAPSFIVIKQKQNYISYCFNTNMLVFKNSKFGSNERALINLNNGDLLVDRPYIGRKKISRVPIVQKYHTLTTQD